MSTTGKPIDEGWPSSMREASPDDPIYKRGLVVGGWHSTRSSKKTPAKSSDEDKPTTKKKS